MPEEKGYCLAAVIQVLRFNIRFVIRIVKFLFLIREVSSAGKYLFEIIRKLEDGKVTLEVNEHLVLSISSENTRACLSGMSPIEYPFIRPPYYHQSANYINVSCNLFISVINQVAGATSTSEAKPILTGVSLEIQGNQLNLIATDGVIRMASINLY